MTTAVADEIHEAVEMAEVLTAEQEESNKPIAKQALGTINLAVFVREVPLKAGGSFSAYNIAARRGYKVGEEWKDQKMHMSLEEAHKMYLGLQQMLLQAYEHKSTAKK